MPTSAILEFSGTFKYSLVTTNNLYEFQLKFEEKKIKIHC